jgi:hypothetical protein
MSKELSSFGGMPAWMQQMRQAAVNAVKAEDITAIVEAQVKKAKEGDRDARNFIFDQVLGGAGMKGATFVQNNYTDTPLPGAAHPLTQKVAASKAAEDRMRERMNGCR